jgi:hypothetical protein
MKKAGITGIFLFVTFVAFCSNECLLLINNAVQKSAGESNRSVGRPAPFSTLFETQANEAAEGEKPSLGKIPRVHGNTGVLLSAPTSCNLSRLSPNCRTIESSSDRKHDRKLR